MKCRKSILFFLFYSIVNWLAGQSGNIVPFTQRASNATPNQLIYKLRGNFTMTGNTNITLQNYTDTGTNAFVNMIYVDVDDDPDTFNSSSAHLVIPQENNSDPACDSIVYAGLYWTGRAHNQNTGLSPLSPNTFTVTNNDGITKLFDKRKVKIKGPSATEYTEITALPEDIYYPENTHGLMYSAYAEVTDYVRTHGVGEYFVADIALREDMVDGTGFYGGWAMVVVYYNPKMDMRDITIFDGHSYVFFEQGGQNEFELPITGFTTIPTGPVRMKLGMIAGEGDVGIAGDRFQIRRFSDNVFENLSHSMNSPTNFFNSSINVGGVPRNPNLQNNTGLDIAMFEIPNPGNTVVGNSQNSVVFKYFTTQDTYIIMTIVMSVNVFSPEPEGIMSITAINGVPPTGTSPYTVNPGDEIEYKIQIINPSNEEIRDFLLDVPIPFASEYVPGSLAATYITSTPPPHISTPFIPPVYIPETTSYGRIQLQIGRIPMDPNDRFKVYAELTFKLKVTENCTILKSSSCNARVLNGGRVYGYGVDSNLPVQFNGVDGRNTITGLNQTNCEIQIERGDLETIIDSEQYILDNCQNVPSEWIFTSCQNVPVTYEQVIAQMPPLVRIYDSFPVTSNSIEYTATNPFPNTLGTRNYYIVPLNSGSCYLSLSINYQQVPTGTITGTTKCFDNSPAQVSIQVNGGSAPYTIEYEFNGQTFTIISNSGTETISTPVTPGTYTYNLISVTDANGCVNSQSSTANAVIHPLPSGNLTGGVSVCQSNNAPEITFTASNGTAPYTFSYTLNGNPLTITSNSTSVSLNPPNIPGTYTYQLIGIQDANSCQQSLSLPPSVLTIHDVPNASISNSTTICSNQTAASVTFTGTGGVLPYSFEYSINGVTQPIVSTTGTQTDASITLPTTPGIYTVNLIRVFDVNCSRNINQSATITVNELPQVSSPTISICDENFDGNFVVDLRNAQSQMVANPSQFSFIYYPSQVDAQNGTNAISSIENYNLGNSLPKSVWVRAQFTPTGCYEITQVTYQQLPSQITQNVAFDAVCSMGVLTSQGFAIFDLTSKNSLINPNGNSFSYYLTESDAKNQTNPISNPSSFQNTIQFNQTIWVRSSRAGYCDAINTITLEVKELPYSTLLVDTAICVDANTTLETGGGFASYQWYFNDVAIPGATQPFLSNVNIPGVYAVHMVGFNGCEFRQQVTVSQNPLPYIVDIKYGNGTVEFIGAGGNPPFEYSINGGQFSMVNFYQLPAGLYDVRIRSGTCQGEVMPVPVVAWPTIFSPNNDGVNDFWKVQGLEFTSEASVRMFDRYGKNFEILNDRNEFTWDGRYLGRPVPTTTYWFLMQFTNPYIQKSYQLNGYVVVKNRNDDFR